MSFQKNVHFFFPPLNQLFSFFPSPSSPAIISEESLLFEYSQSKDRLFNTSYYACLDFSSIENLFKIGDLTLLYQHPSAKEVYFQILSFLFPKTKENPHFFSFLSEENLKKELKKRENQKKIILHFDSETLSWLASEKEYFLLVQITVLNLNYFHVEEFNRTNPFKLVENCTLNLFPLLKKKVLLTCNNIIQHFEVYYLIHLGEITFNNLSIDEYIKSKTVVLVMVRSLFRRKDFFKAYFFVSKGEVLYKFHIGGDDSQVNKPFHILNSKMGKIDDKVYYKDLLLSIDSVNSHENQVFLVNSCLDLKVFQDKFEMNQLISSFISSEKWKFIKSTKNLYFKTISCLLSENIEFSFPFILKFGGEDSENHHKTILIQSEKGLSHIIEQEKEEVPVILQEYIESRYVIKAYRINKETWLVKRRLVEREREKEFLIVENKKNEEKIENFMAKDILTSDLEEEISRLMVLFEEKTRKNLFGLDFLLEESKEKRVFLIDCNFFPGYKELKPNISDLMRNHCLTYYTDFIKKTQKPYFLDK